MTSETQPGQASLRDVNERDRAEPVLRQGHDGFNDLFDNAPVGILDMDAAGRLMRVNNTVLIMLGYNAEELMGQFVWKISAEPETTRHTVLTKLRGEMEPTHHLERIFRRKDGSTLPVLITERIVKREDGAIIGLQAGIQDITESKKAEEKLKLTRALIDNSADAIHVVDPVTARFLDVNEHACRALGYTREEHLALTVFDVVMGVDRARFDEAFRQAKKSGHLTVESQHRRKDGSIYPVEVSLTPVTLGREYLVVVVRDITERKLADQFQARLATAVEQAAETIVITDTRGTILYANPAFEKTTGYTRAEAIGQNPRLFKSGKQDADFYRRMWETIARGAIWSGHFINRRKDGAFYEEESTISPVRDAAGTIVNYVAVKRNVTREKQLEAQMHQAQKMEAIGQLAGGVAHDFNNILNVIIGYSHLLTADLDPDSPLRNYIEEILEAAGRASGLTRQLLLFSRKQNVEPVVLDLNDVVKDLDKMLRRLIGENIEMAVVPGEDIGRVQANSGHIGQVLMNLVVNARDAMPNGGKLTIATRNVTLNAPLPRRGCRPAAGNYVMLSVSDTGMGMAPEVKARLFEALFTTKPAGKGTGLGLATCQTIVQQSGGCIDVESEVGQGATFKIYFPRVEKPLETAARPAQTGPLPRGEETLLLVEDEPSVRHLAAGVLETQGYTVLRANNGQEALNLVQSHKGLPIRMVVTDVVMPRMGGKMMVDWLKATYPDLKVLFTSGYTDEAIGNQGVLEPGVAFLAKPYSPEALARKVRTVLDNLTDPAELPKPGENAGTSTPDIPRNS